MMFYYRNVLGINVQHSLTASVTILACDIYYLDSMVAESDTYVPGRPCPSLKNDTSLLLEPVSIL